MLGSARPGLRQARGRLTGLAVILLAHAGLLALLAGGMAARQVAIPPHLIMASILPRAIPTPSPPHQPPVPVEKTEPPIVPRPVARPKPRPVATPAPSLHAITLPPAPPAQPAPAAASESRPEPVHVAAALAISHSCRLPEYPPISRRLGETGTVSVKFLIDETGAVLDSSIEQSSGYPRLDEAARDALSLCQFKPGTVDGRPERAWARIRYVWKLE